MTTPSRALVQIIGAHKPFKTSMCIEQTISLMKMFKVEFPEVAKMNVKNSMHFKQGGFRHFNAHRLPSVKYHNQHIEFSVEKPRDSYAEGKAPCGIEVIFANGETVFVDAINKKSQQVWNDLVQAAKGKDHSAVARPAPPTLPNPVYFKSEGGDQLNEIITKFGYAPYVVEESKSRKRR